MTSRRKKSNTFYFVLVSVVLVGLSVCWYRRELRQHALNRALVTAVRNHDDVIAIALLNRGADGAVTDSPFAPVNLGSELTDIWNRFWGRKTSLSPPILAHVYGLLGFGQPDTSMVEMIVADGNEDYNREQDAASHARLISEMVAHGASLTMNYKQRSVGSELLYYAAIACDAPTVKLLLEHHVSPGPARSGETPPLICTDNFECQRLLLEHGADPNLTYTGGRTRLMFVRDLRIYPLLVKYGANVNAKDDDGQTALIRLFQSGYLPDTNIHAGLQFLLQHGASASIRDKSGKTAQDYAREDKIDLQVGGRSERYTDADVRLLREAMKRGAREAKCIMR